MKICYACGTPFRRYSSEDILAVELVIGDAECWEEVYAEISEVSDKRKRMTYRDIADTARQQMITDESRKRLMDFLDS